MTGELACRRPSRVVAQGSWSASGRFGMFTLSSQGVTAPACASRGRTDSTTRRAVRAAASRWVQPFSAWLKAMAGTPNR
jgi:hypothetical protein